MPFNPKNKEACRRWRLAHPEKYKAGVTMGNQKAKARQARWRLKNKERVSENIKAWRATPKGVIATRESGWRSQGIVITMEDFLDRLAEQRFKCGICNDPIDVAGHVDHDHATGGVRGILCLRCNSGLGGFRDSITILLRAVGYLADQQGV